MHISRRIELFEADGTTLWKAGNLQERLIGGEISVDGSRDERRSLSNLILSNKDKFFKHEPGGLWYDKIVKVYRGLLYETRVNNVLVPKKFEIQIGEFMIDTINTQRFPNHVTIAGRDYAKKLLLDQFAVDTTYATGQPLDTIVRIIATNGGINKFRLGATGVTVSTPVALPRGSSRWEGIKTLCEGLNVEVYFDHQGFLVTRLYDDVSTAAPHLSLQFDGEARNLVDFSKSTSDSNIFNHIVVTGTSEEETVTGYKFISIRENNDPNSPTSIQKIGRRTFPYEVSYLTSQTQANELSLRLLNVKQLEDYALNFQTICYPWLEANRVVQFDDPDEPETVPTRFFLTSFSIPMELGPMSGDAKRIIIVGQPNSVVEEEAQP